MDASSAVTATEAVELTRDGAWLMDVREPVEWEIGHAPQAHLLPMSTIIERLSEVPTGRRLLVICHSGARSLRVAEWLRDAGYDAVNVSGGMAAWADAGGELAADGQEEPRVE